MSNFCPSGKRSFIDEELAFEALIQHHVINEYSSDQGPRNVYQCEDCGKWHFTSKGHKSPLEDAEIQSRINKERLANRWERKLK